MELHDNTITAERALLVALDTGDYDVESSLQELWELTKTSGAEPVATKVQKREAPRTGTCVGSGMVLELGEFCKNEGLDLMIFDRELTPTQIRNLEKETDIRVIDRTMLILDIFALRARTAEGKLQVESAQLKYLMPRLSGKGVALSRLGGGIGTRGPGESKLETDKRHIRKRIDNLRDALLEVEKSRREIDKRRKKDGTLTVALVGYTNAGKSTLMNRLTDAGVLVEDKLFATLDPTARALKLPSGKNVMLIDTVGFIRRLPHHLVDAFKSTLEQAAYADVILNICDASNPEAREHLAVTDELLAKLGSAGRPIIPVLNKWDKVVEENVPALLVHDSVRISALNGDGIEELLLAIEQALPEKNRKLTLLLPFEKSGIAAEIRKDGIVIQEEWVENGLKISALVGDRLYERIEEFRLDQ
ncbi:MAG: GTPase HflX [Oscillospiraceae bacterium]